MKFISFYTQPYEVDSLKRWAEANDVEITIEDCLLDADSIEKAKGYDGITIQQVIPMKDPEIFKKVASYGIKQIASRTAGVDMFGLEAAREAGVSITNVPRYSPNAIAEMAVTQAMCLLRKLPTLQNNMRQGKCKWSPDVIVKEIRSCTVGVIGTGFIGLTVAKLFRGLGANVIGYDVFKNPNAEGIIEYKETLEEVLGASDVITLHLPLIESTHHLLNAETIPKIKKGAIVINTGRGGLIDMDAFIPFLDNGHIAGAGIDVLENEELYVNQVIDIEKVKGTYIEELMNRENVIWTGHYAFFTETAVDNMVTTSLENLKTELETGEINNLKN